MVSSSGSNSYTACAAACSAGPAPVMVGGMICSSVGTWLMTETKRLYTTVATSNSSRPSISTAWVPIACTSANSTRFLPANEMSPTMLPAISRFR